MQGEGRTVERLCRGKPMLKVSTKEVRKRREYIGPVPQIEAPKSLDDIGRQWSAEGPDVPKRK